jgi:hypothetical protein
MGGSQSRTKVLNASITNVAMDSVVKHSTSTSGSIIGVQNYTLGENASSTGLTMTQLASISLSTLSDTNVNASMQSDMIAEITNAIDKEKAGLPEITSNISDSEIQNIVETNVSNTFSVEKMDALSASINLTQNVALGKGAQSTNDTIIQEGTVVAELASSMSNNIVAAMTAGTVLDNTVKEVTKNPISDIVTSVTDGISGLVSTLGDQFGFSPEMIMLFFVIVIAGAYAAKLKLGNKSGPPPGYRPPMARPNSGPPMARPAGPPQPGYRPPMARPAGPPPVRSY